MAGTSTTTVEVDIFGATYHVRGDDDTSHLQKLAAVVDQKMREVAGHSSSVDRAKVAILAALNIADELARLRVEHAAETRAAGAKVKELTGTLEQALEAG
ncbi:MAG TPA: cell division protein ZapA [Thermoanaerobaculia bacterium]|nr:cell division protein ZapA [Thermoanaerobaculia bacterium]